MSVILIVALIVGGLLMIFMLGKEEKKCIPAGIFLLLMGGWKLADHLTDGALSASWAIWPYRVVLLLVMVAGIAYILRERKNAAGQKKN